MPARAGTFPRVRCRNLEPVYGGDQSDSFRNFLLEAGLKLVSAKGPIETFLIDSAPTLGEVVLGVLAAT